MTSSTFAAPTSTTDPHSGPRTAGARPARQVAATLELRTDGPAHFALAIAVAAHLPVRDERLVVSVDGEPSPDVRELTAPVGGRLHVVDLPAGDVRVEYSATVDDADSADSAVGGSPEPTKEELLAATRPSRYADSDKLAAVAATELAGLEGLALLDAATDWVHGRLSYVLGSSRPTDAASDVLLAGSGVCRDYAHLVAALLRARDVPARVVAVYAPGLDPMDFHAVTEAWVEGAWHLADATRLAPRGSLVRIATGRDTADTAFLTTSGPVTLLSTEIVALVDGEMALDDGGPVRLA